jgi:hypothetical protein
MPREYRVQSGGFAKEEVPTRSRVIVRLDLCAPQGLPHLLASLVRRAMDAKAHRKIRPPVSQGLARLAPWAAHRAMATRAVSESIVPGQPHKQRLVSVRRVISVRIRLRHRTAASATRAFTVRGTRTTKSPVKSSQEATVLVALQTAQVRAMSSLVSSVVSGYLPACFPDAKHNTDIHT